MDEPTGKSASKRSFDEVILRVRPWEGHRGRLHPTDSKTRHLQRYLSLAFILVWLCWDGQRIVFSDTHIHRYTRGQYEHDDTLADSEQPACPEESNCEITRSPLDLPLHRPSCIDNEYTDQTRSPKVLWYTLLSVGLLIITVGP